MSHYDRKELQVSTLETRHYIGVTELGRLHMKLGPAEPEKFNTSATEPMTLDNGSVLYPVSAEVAEEWDSDDDDLDEETRTERGVAARDELDELRQSISR